MSWKRWKELNKITKNAIKICVFLLITIIPFISATQIIGLETFLDSFENPEYYLCLQDENSLLGSITENGEYVIIQKSAHPNFNVQESDSIIYWSYSGDVTCEKVNYIKSVGAIKKYHVTDEITNQPIYEGQILGKVIKVIDGNLWNSIAIKIWETSVHNLNVRALLTN